MLLRKICKTPLKCEVLLHWKVLIKRNACDEHSNTLVALEEGRQEARARGEDVRTHHPRPDGNVYEAMCLDILGNLVHWRKDEPDSTRVGASLTALSDSDRISRRGFATVRHSRTHSDGRFWSNLRKSSPQSATAQIFATVQIIATAHQTNLNRHSYFCVANFDQL